MAILLEKDAQHNHTVITAMVVNFLLLFSLVDGKCYLRHIDNFIHVLLLDERVRYFGERDAIAPDSCVSD